MVIVQVVILIIVFHIIAEDFSEAAKDVNVAASELLAKSHSPCEEDDDGCKLLFPVEDGVGHFIFKPFLPFYEEEQGFPSSQDILEWGISRVSVCIDLSTIHIESIDIYILLLILIVHRRTWTGSHELQESLDLQQPLLNLVIQKVLQQYQ